MHANEFSGLPVYCHWACKDRRWYGRLTWATPKGPTAAYFLRIADESGVFRWYDSITTFVDLEALLGSGGAWQAIDDAD